MAGYKISIEGPGLKMDREVAEEVGQQVVMLVMSGGAIPAVTPPSRDEAKSARPVATTPGDALLSMREYLDAVEPKRNPDKVVAIGLFLKTHRNRTTFTSADLESGFEEAAEPVPGNLPRDVKWAVKNAWIAPSTGEKGSYYVTAEGQKAVEAKFPRDLIKKTTVPQRKKSGSRGQKEG